MRNCQKFSVENNTFTATCGTNKKVLDLDMNHCIANIDGDLKFAKDGNYGNSCKECELKSNGYGIFFLHCKCKGVAKNLGGIYANLKQDNMKFTYISLSEKIIITQHTKTLSCLPDLVLEEEKTRCIKCEDRAFLA